ncbi:hypothetical protein TWF694_006718 [Orbilia ellipsospora]|uniref:Metal-dependent hydrolase n=1 Tax=Orbilia ellipsospora TaxID=2528407 RepID=A0AAV9XLD7_9PEZI
MWVAHFAPSLVLSRFAPATPLWALGLAGALPDLIFFGLAAAGLESSHHSHSIPSSPEIFGLEFKGSTTNCFPFSAVYPYTHSTAGQLVLASVFATLITVSHRLSLTSYATLVLATLSHLPLDMAIHRLDAGTPAGADTRPIWKRHDVPLFNYPWGTYISDLGIFLFAVLFHARTVYPPDQHAAKMGIPIVPMEQRRDFTSGYLKMLAVAACLQAHFSFWGGGEVEQGDLAKAAIAVVETLGFAYVLSVLEGYTSVKLETRKAQSKKKQ